MWKAADLTSKTNAAGHSYCIKTPSGRECYPPEGRQWAPSYDTYVNREAKEWADKLADLQFVYIPRAPIDGSELENSQVWVARCVANYFYNKRYSEYSFYDEVPNQEAYEITMPKNKLRKMKKGFDQRGWTKDSEIIVEELYEYLLDEYDEERMKNEIQKLKETLEDTQYEKSFNIELYESGNDNSRRKTYFRFL